MGGKTKQTQNRTKNNSRPSNSSRSAELFGGSLPAFVGFTSLSNCGGDVPVLPGFQTSSAATAESSLLDEIDANVDSRFQMVLRKMTKKDATTKVKALQEFNDLVNASEVDVVVAVLPFWPRLYANLATDVEHRVREASQQSQAAVSKKCGKSIAPYLRQLAPSWITSQYDTYAPAASIATQSFQKAFRPPKQQEVFTYCQQEILEFVTKNLTIITPASMSTANRTLTPEECDAKFTRIVTSSLKGYTQYLTKMSAEQLAEAADRNAAIIDNGKFWTFHKYKSTHIRAAWFETLSAILQCAPSLVEGHQAQATSSAFQALDETEPGVLPHVWSAILLVTQKIDDWPTHINMEKALLPKIWKVLKAGGFGSASVIYPHFLPLLAKLNGTVLGDKLQPFYTDFFQNLNVGLRARSSQQSRSDMSAIATAYFECLQYVLIQLQRTESEELQAYAKQLVQVHLVDTVGWCLANDINGTKSIFASIATLVGYWTTQSAAAGGNALYAEMLKHFWKELYSVLERSLETDERTERILDMQFDLVQSLRSGHAARAKNVKVKFSTETDEVDAVKPTPVVQSCELSELALRLCLLYMRKATETMAPLYINNLETLLNAFGSEAFYKQLAGGDDASIFKLFDKWSVWLLIAQLRQENVVDILFHLYPFLGAEDKEQLLNKLVKFPNEHVQLWVILRLLSHPMCSEPSVPRLLRQPNVAKILLKCAEDLLDDKANAKDNINFLHKCFFQNENGEILIDEQTCRQIIEVVASALTDPERVEVQDCCASFLAQVMTVIYCDEKKADLQALMFLKFFEFSVNQEASDYLTQDTIWEITTSWQDALSSNDLTLSDALLKQCAEIINAKLANVEETTVERIENISEIVAKLILCSIERIDDESAKCQRADQIIEAIFDQRSRNYRSKQSYAEHVCLFLDSLNGLLSVPDLGSRLGTTECMKTVETIDSFVKLAAFRFGVIFKITCSVKKHRPAQVTNGEHDDDDETGDDEYTEDFCDIDENLVKTLSPNLSDEILSGIHVAAMSDTLLGSNYPWSQSTELCMLHLTEQVPLYLQNASPKSPWVKERLFQAARDKGLFWAKSVLFLTSIEPYNDPENGLTLLREEDELNNLPPASYVNVLQTFASETAKRMLPIERNVFVENADADLLVKSATLRCLIENYANTDLNNQDDRTIMESSVGLLNSLYLECSRDKAFFLYNEDITNVSSDRIIMITEIANLYTAVIRTYPYRLETAEWDLIRIAVSSWVLTASKSSDSFQMPKVAVFIMAVYKLFHAFYSFISTQEIKSSTHLLGTVIEEWNHLFAKDVNLILLKCYLKFVSKKSGQLNDIFFVDMLSQYIHIIDFRHVTAVKRIDSKTSMDDLIGFALENLSHKSHTVRMACTTILKQLASGLIATDLATMQQQNESVEASKEITESWHLLHKFRATIERHQEQLREYREEFTFKSNELDDLSDVPRDISIPFLLLWDCIIEVCAKSGSEIRSTYAAFLTETQFVQTLLVSLFRLMPVEILRSQDAKHVGQPYFVPLQDSQIKANDVSAKRLACHIYLRTLRHLPAAARKWWHDSASGQKTLVDKITTSYVSAQLCQDELRALVDKKEKHENMQISVHTSTREVLATYMIDEARMELVVTLPINHPLGSVKVDSGKQIGGRLQGRVLVMQLTIFLTHQNGSISDGLLLWKRNLDRKFEGVQECYVCYSVIHQDTCQLPKLSCRKCKNKFHGPCLYKWFSTSNKSTCPICRSLF